TDPTNGPTPRHPERQHHIQRLLAITRLLHIGDLAAATVGDPRLGDLARVDGVVALDVLGADDAGDDQFSNLEVDADLLLALDDEIAVRQYLGDHGGDIGAQRFGAVHRALPVARRCGIRRAHAAR